ncbi:MAG TPA: hypothetical protein VHZ07_08810 [Bryobacteraceae bacterium]|jgi:hypothetical protein|nr:hypothetical protein [Bryobacteraceae bacterium]
MRGSVFLAHGDDEGAFASALAAFLESGRDVTCTRRAVSDPKTGLIDVAEEGVSSDFLVLLLSRSCCPVRWNWPDWDRRVMQEAATVRTTILTMALDSCTVPGLLRRQNFVDAQADRPEAMRLLKRWIRRCALGLSGAPNPAFSAAFEPLYTALADKPGVLTFDGEEGYRFASETAEDFDAVLPVPCHARSLAQVCGELSQQLGLTLTGPADANARQIRNLLYESRCLLLLDGPSTEVLEALLPTGQTSTLITTGPVRLAESPQTFEYGRLLMDQQRYAEAYELFDRLVRQEVAPKACRQELAWILEHWDRFDEARALRLIDAEPFTQLSLF